MPLTEQQIESLLNQGEGVALDYKKDQYRFDGASDEEKGELLKDILALSNSWREVEAFILIGVDELPDRRGCVVGINNHLDDAKLQQFVNTKTNRPLVFAYEVVNHKGLQLGVLRVPKQRRPFFLKKPFGRLRAETVYVRRGSSTAEAGPDEIAQMGNADEKPLAPMLEVELADIQRHELLGRLVSLNTELLTPLAESELPRVRGDGGVPVSFGYLNTNFYHELSQYVMMKALARPLGLVVTNRSSALATGVGAEIHVPHNEQYFLLDEVKFPSAPQQRLGPELPPGLGPSEDIWVVNRQGSYELNADFGKVQPKATVWTENVFYIAVTRDCAVKLAGQLFSDNAEPVSFELSVSIAVSNRPMTIEDLIREEDLLDEN